MKQKGGAFPVTTSKLKGRLVTCVWGKWHTEMFIWMTLRSLMAQGNLPTLCKRQSISYTIVTTQKHAAEIRSSPVYSQLESLLPVDILERREKDFPSGTIVPHLNVWKEEIDKAKRNSEWVFLVAADLVFSDGMLSDIGTRFEQGYDGIFCPAQRVVSETLTPHIDSLFPRSQKLDISIPKHDLQDLLIKHLHPICASYLRQSPHYCFHAEHLLYPIPGQGLLLRLPVSNVCALNPQKVALSENLVPIDKNNFDRFVVLSQDVCPLFVSLTPIMKDVDWYFPHAHANADTTGAWWPNYYCPVHDRLSSQNYRFSIEDNPPKKWKEAEASASFFVQQSLAATFIHMIYWALWRSGYTKSAQMLAMAHVSQRLRRKLTVRTPISIFAPDDKAWALVEDDKQADLASPAGSGRLLSLIKNHMLEARFDIDRKKQTFFVIRTNGDREKIVPGRPFYVKNLLGYDVEICLESWHIDDQREELIKELKKRLKSGLFIFHHKSLKRFLKQLAIVYEYYKVREKLSQPRIRIGTTTTTLIMREQITEHIQVLGISALLWPLHWEQIPDARVIPHSILKAFSPMPQNAVNDEPLVENHLPELKSSQKYFEVAQRFRMVGALKEVVCYYVKSMELPDYSPLSWLEQTIDIKNFDSHAEKLLLRAIELEPKTSEPHFALAGIYFKKGLWDMALREYLCAESGREKTKPLHDIKIKAQAGYFRGLIFEYLNQPDMAIECYQKASRIARPYPEVHKRLAICLLQKGQYLAALSHADKTMYYCHCYPDMPKLTLKLKPDKKFDFYEI